MLNFTLTITAAPELLAVMSGFTSAITAAKVVTIPETNSEFPDHQLPMQTAPAKASKASMFVESYTMEQLALAATQLIDDGRRTELVSLLNSFGVQAVNALPKEQYGTFAERIKALGVAVSK